MSIHWPDSITVGDRVFESTHWRTQCYTHTKPDAQPKWLIDNEGVHWRHVGADPAPEIKPDYDAMQPYVHCGYDLIPLGINRKFPTDDGWPTRDYSKTELDAARAAGFNFGIRPKRDQLIIDVDVKDPAKDGAASFAKLCANTGLDPLTCPRVNTPSGGYHLYMTNPTRAEIPKIQKQYPGIDFISCESYQAVAAGSVVNGKCYGWHPDHPTLDVAPAISPKMIEALTVKQAKSERPKADKAALNEDQLAAILAVLDPLNFKVGDAWRDLLWAIHQGTAGAAWALKCFKAWSARDPEFTNEQARTEDTWNRASADREGGVTVATLFKELKDRGHGDLIPKKARRVPHELPWRECRVNGSPLPSMYNARLAIQALGIACSYDTFHNKMLFGFSDDDVRHELQFMLGENLDNAIVSLRQKMSERFGVDLEDKATRDGVKSLALEHCFDPVRDEVDQEQALWEADRVPRLDRFAPDYLNTEDTPLNRAIGRKTLISSVKRVRHPSCKHDEITVLESDEGWNKSTAINTLAGDDDNFSDESILGVKGREVQEQLGTVWMHENADLAGIQRAQVEEVKNFASKRFDRARPAYGHFLIKQPRHSIEWGTTNDATYLQSQTGNRRFWCMKVTKMIDIEKLKRDRMLLLGEAAYYEAQGESLTLDEKLWPVAREAQEERRVKHPWENILDDIPSQFIHRVPVADSLVDHELVASADLLLGVLHIEPDRQNQGHGMTVASIMKRLGWQRAPGGKVFIGKKQVAGYWRKAPPKIGVEDAKSDEGGQNVIPF